MMTTAATHVPVSLTSMMTTAATHVPVSTATVIPTSPISTTASPNNAAELVPLGVEVLFHHNLPALVVKPVHLVDGQLGHLLGGEFHHSGASWFARLVIEELDIGNLAHLLSEEVLDLLPLHLIGQVGNEDPLISRASVLQGEVLVLELVS